MEMHSIPFCMCSKSIWPVRRWSAQSRVFQRIKRFIRQWESLTTSNFLWLSGKGGQHWVLSHCRGTKLFVIFGSTHLSKIFSPFIENMLEYYAELAVRCDSRKNTPSFASNLKQNDVASWQIISAETNAILKNSFFSTAIKICFG